MKRLLYLILLLLLAFSLAACGGDEAEPAEEDMGDTEEVSEVEDTEEEADTEEADSEEDMEAEELECTDPIGCVQVDPGEPIRVASALVVSGPNTQLGIDSQYGVEIALDKRGELLGHPLELQPEDEQCNAEGGQTAAQKIVSDPTIVGMIGTSCSGAGVPASQVIADAGYVMISPSNTAPVLTDPEQRNAGYFRTAHNDLIQGRAMAVYALDELGVTTAAAIHDGDPYTEGLASAFSDAFQELGGEIVAFEAEDPNATNVSPVLTTVAAAGPPELIYYPVFIPLGPNLTRQAQDVEGLEEATLAGADGLISPDFLEAAGDAAIGMYISGPDLGFENEEYDDFLQRYQEAYGSEPLSAFHAHAYDATNMLLNAIEEVAQVGDDGTVLIGRQALRDAIAATEGFQGITGTLTCDEYGDCADPRISVNEIQETDEGLDYVPVWEYVPEE
jgi:branched-chain amino acid transport system substrate-binding protein